MEKRFSKFHFIFLQLVNFFSKCYFVSCFTNWTHIHRWGVGCELVTDYFPLKIKFLRNVYVNLLENSQSCKTAVSARAHY
jgi:hypothetical protein